MPEADAFVPLTLPDLSPNVTADGWASIASEAVADWCQVNAITKVTLIAEPEGMDHSIQDVPARLPNVRAQLPRILKDHITIGENELLGWSCEMAWPVGGTFKTILHAESMSMIRPIVDRITASRISVKTVISWFSAAEILAKVTTKSGSHPIAAISVTASGVSYAVLAPAAKRTAGFFSAENEGWLDLNNILEDAGFGTQSGIQSRTQTPRLLVADLDGSAARRFLNPDDGLIRNVSQFKVELLPVNKLSERIVKIRFTSEQNIAEAFPRPFDLNPFLKAASVACAVAILTFGFLYWSNQRDLEASRALHVSKINELKETVNSLAKNKEKQTAIEAHFNDRELAVPRGRLAALETLARVTPTSITLTRFKLDENSNYEVEALVVGARNDESAVNEATNFRKALLVAGFTISDSDKGWKYDIRMHKITMGGGWEKGLEMRSLAGFPLRLPAKEEVKK